MVVPGIQKVSRFIPTDDNKIIKLAKGTISKLHFSDLALYQHQKQKWKQ